MYKNEKSVFLRNSSKDNLTKNLSFSSAGAGHLHSNASLRIKLHLDTAGALDEK